ncbi:MAG: aminopeptidase P family protein [Clostridia bacterium]|nr:aminopeptidase P family protein [Clostridia bacterium]
MNRCDKLRKLFSDDEIIYISSYPNVFYYSNFTSEDAFLVITKERQILFTDSRYTIQAHLQAPDYEIIDISERNKTIKELKEEVLCYEEDNITVKQYETLKTLNKTLKPYTSVIKKPRTVKDKYELLKIAKAEQLGDEAFSYILNRISPGRSEREIALELEFFMRKNGADALSFETICASGIRSAMPHGTASDKIIEKGDLLTMDFGCILDGYCSDMTRTVIVGQADERQKEIYDIVLKAQLAALEVLKAGVKCSDADMAARKVITDSGYGKNFGHSTGHSVGIEIHELPVLSAKSTDILETGNVVTVEPGIYIEGFGGVRIEDLVQITSEKAVNLTKSEKKLLII